MTARGISTFSEKADITEQEAAVMLGAKLVFIEVGCGRPRHAPTHEPLESFGLDHPNCDLEWRTYLDGRIELLAVLSEASNGEANTTLDFDLKLSMLGHASSK